MEVAGMSGLMVNMNGIVNATTSPGRDTAKTPAMNSMRPTGNPRHAIRIRGTG